MYLNLHSYSHLHLPVSRNCEALECKNPAAEDEHCRKLHQLKKLCNLQLFLQYCFLFVAFYNLNTLTCSRSYYFFWKKTPTNTFYVYSELSLAGVLGVLQQPWNFGVLLTLFQPEGADYAHHTTASTPGFENLMTSLHRVAALTDNVGATENK